MWFEVSLIALVIYFEVLRVTMLLWQLFIISFLWCIKQICSKIHIICELCSNLNKSAILCMLPTIYRIIPGVTVHCVTAGKVTQRTHLIIPWTYIEKCIKQNTIMSHLFFLFRISFNWRITVNVKNANLIEKSCSRSAITMFSMFW